MSDTERLNLIEHYEWMVMPHCGKWWIVGKFPGIASGDSLREAFNNAYDAQAKWALQS